MTTESDDDRVGQVMAGFLPKMPGSKADDTVVVSASGGNPMKYNFAPHEVQEAGEGSAVVFNAIP